MLGVSCLSSYLTSLGVYDNDSVVEYLGLGDDEIVDLETANKRLWEEIDQALHIVRLVSYTLHSVVIIIIQVSFTTGSHSYATGFCHQAAVHPQHHLAGEGQAEAGHTGGVTH